MYPYLVAMSKRRKFEFHTYGLCETRTWRCDRQRLIRFQYSRYQLFQIFRTTKPNDCKNLTFDAVSFFLECSNIFDRCRPSGKNYVLSVSSARSEQAFHVIVVFLYRRLRTCNLMVIFFSAKIEQSSVLIS